MACTRSWVACWVRYGLIFLMFSNAKRHERATEVLCDLIVKVNNLLLFLNCSGWRILSNHFLTETVYDFKSENLSHSGVRIPSTSITINCPLWCPHAAPSAVPTVHLMRATADTLSLSWLPPEKPNGVILDYEIKYQERVSSHFLMYFTVQALLPLKMFLSSPTKKS